MDHLHHGKSTDHRPIRAHVRVTHGQLDVQLDGQQIGLHQRVLRLGRGLHRHDLRIHLPFPLRVDSDHPPPHRLRRRPDRQLAGLRVRLQEPQHEDRHQLLHCELGRRRFPRHTRLSAADRAVGRHQDVVLREFHLQVGVVSAGKIIYFYSIIIY